MREAEFSAGGIEFILTRAEDGAIEVKGKNSSFTRTYSNSYNFFRHFLAELDWEEIQISTEDYKSFFNLLNSL